MLEDLKEEGIVQKVGGRFKLSTLIQKRLVQLQAGSRPLVEGSTQDKMQVVLQEIIQDKIYLDTTSPVRVVGEYQGSTPRARCASSASIRARVKRWNWIWEIFKRPAR
jgi:DNA-directed RNA polymerase subunit omega